MRLPDWRAAVYAGVAAGIVSTVAQVALWLLFDQPWPEILFRDTRLAAAIVMGPRILDTPAGITPTLAEFVVATLIHFALSVTYGLLLSLLIFRYRERRALSAVLGLAFGAALFASNMYLFTAIYPWFVAARDWITLAAHLVFGLSAAASYRALARP